MQLAEVGGKTGLSPVGRIGAVPSAGVIVVAVDVRATGLSGDEEANCSGLVVNYFKSVRSQDSDGLR